MRDKVKRFISILMTALMLVNLLPVGALADGITSGGYQQATIANGNQTVYLYVKVTGNLNGLNLNKSGWCTVGKVTGLNMTDPQSYAWWYGSSNHVSSVSGISASSVGKGDVERYEKNQSIDLSKVTWASGTHYGFLPVSTGADDYVGSGWTWHLDGYIDIAQVQASYKIRYVDQDTNKVLQTAASGTDDPGVWIDHTAPKTLEGGYEIVGDTDRTFKLEQIDNTFNIYYRRPYGYTVEYYYDDVKDKDATVIGESQMCGTEINTYTPKLKDGYELDRVENCPLTIGTDESKNVIKVYYKKIGYTVTYEPGEHGTFKTQKHDAKHGDATPAFDGETTGKPGWKFDGWEPEVADTVTENATYTAVFVPDENKKAAVLYTISLGQSDYGSIDRSGPQIIFQATGKLDMGGSVSGSTATAKPGYKFAGWYKATGEDTYEKVTGDPELTSELAESTLNRDKETGLYRNTVFEARFELDETAKVTYTAENGTVDNASDTILKVDASGLTGSTATPNPGYKFDGWYKGDERITTDLTLTPEMAKDKLDKDENGLYVNATFTAKCKLDEDQNATVLYTIFRGQSDYGSIAPAAQQIILQATGKLASGDPISGSTATANKGYKFVGWYKVTGWTTEWITEWITDKPELTPELAEQNLTRNEQGLYQNTVFAAKFELDENDQAEVIYQVENGTILNTSGSTSISQFVQVVTGEGLTDVTATPNPGYKFDGWYKGDERITTDLTLTPEMAKDKLDKDENGLYVNTTFTAKCVLDEDQNATVLCTIDKTQIGYGTVYPSIYQTILQATGKLANGDPISGSMATANPGYKFVGWYKVTGEATYEKVTDDPELTSELAESELNRDEKTGLYRNTVFEARFELDAGAKVPVTYEAENGTLEGTTSQEAQVVTGEGLTDVTATPNKGYKFDGWYAVDKNGDKHLISGLDPAEELDAKTAKENLNKDGNLYAKTTFIARFVPDENQTVPVIYTTDENGILWGGPAIGSITYNVNIATGKVWLNNSFVNELPTVPTYPKEGYEFDRWIRVSPETTIEGADSALTDEMARPNLNQEDGLYRETKFKAIFKPQTNLSYTVNYYWNGNHQNPIKSESGTATYGQIVNPKTDVSGYTLMPGQETSLTIGTGENVLNLYYYKNVKLTANSDEKTYDGKPKSVSDYTCEVAKVHEDGTVEYVTWTGEPLTFEFVGAFGSGTDAGDHEVTFKEGSLGENNGLYYVKEVQPGTLTIKPALIKLRAPSASKTYDGTPLKAEDYGYGYEGNTDLADDFASISVDGSQTMVGSSASSVTYELKQGKIPNNYNIQCIPGTLTITPVMDEVLVEITGNTASVTYDGQLHKVDGYDASSISNSLYTANDFTYNGVAKAEGTDAATYPMNLAETRFENTNPNFENVRFEVVEDGQLVINPRPVVLTSADLTKVYDGTALTNGDTPVTVGGDGFADGEGATYDFTGSQTDVGKSENTFTYKAEEGTNTKLTNYAITTEFGTLEVTPVTDKVTVTIKGGKSSVTYNGEEHTVSGYKVSDISNPLYTANDFTFSGTAEAKGKNADLYKMGLKAADFANTSNNFKNVEFVVADGQLEITKRPVMLTSADLTKVYDGTPLKNGDTPVKEEFGTEDAFPKGEGVTYTFKGSQTNAGSSKNMFTYAWNEGTNKDNYTIYQVEGDLVVTPIDGIKVTITGRKDTQTYDGKEHSVFGFDAEPSNALYNPKEDMQFNGTDVDMIAKGTDAGQYDIGLTAEHFTNKSNNFTNVTFVVTDGYVKINPRAVTLTSETAGKTYDGTALEKPVVTVGGDGFVEGQVKEIKATGSVTNAGSVANTITFTPDKETFKEGNYAITKNEGTLTIAKRSVLLTSQSATKTYDGSALTRPAVTITGDGFVPGELAKVEATGSITNVGSTPNAIQYTTTGAFNPDNYSIALSVGTLTVTAKPEPEPRRTFNLTVNYVYQNGKRAAASYNRGGLKNGETFDITSPVIAGYTASETVVSGTIDNRDIKVTVIYTADGVNLDDYAVPLGLGNITMNVGDCFE